MTKAKSSSVEQTVKKIAAAKASKKALFRTNDEPGTPTTKKFTDRLTEADDIDFTTKSSKVFH